MMKVDRDKLRLEIKRLDSILSSYTNEAHRVRWEILGVEAQIKALNRLLAVVKGNDDLGLDILVEAE